MTWSPAGIPWVCKKWAGKSLTASFVCRSCIQSPRYKCSFDYSFIQKLVFCSKEEFINVLCSCPGVSWRRLGNKFSLEIKLHSDSTQNAFFLQKDVQFVFTMLDSALNKLWENFDRLQLLLMRHDSKNKSPTSHNVNVVCSCATKWIWDAQFVFTIPNTSLLTVWCEKK